MEKNLPFFLFTFLMFWENQVWYKSHKMYNSFIWILQGNPFQKQNTVLKNLIETKNKILGINKLKSIGPFFSGKMVHFYGHFAKTNNGMKSGKIIRYPTHSNYSSKQFISETKYCLSKMYSISSQILLPLICPYS